MKNDINTLLQKQMDRKGFIKHVAIGFAALVGVTTVVKTLTTMTNGDKNQTTSSTGYGSSSYGGRPSRSTKQS